MLYYHNTICTIITFFLNEYEQYQEYTKPVTPIEIEAEILSIPLNKVYGLYSCPTRILKCAIE